MSKKEKNKKNTRRADDVEEDASAKLMQKKQVQRRQYQGRHWKGELRTPVQTSRNAIVDFELQADRAVADTAGTTPPTNPASEKPTKVLLVSLCQWQTKLVGFYTSKVGGFQ